MVPLSTPLPIVVMYATAVVCTDGPVHFFHDIYGQDAALRSELAKGYPY
jgi:murein L,D-transpeptidase YcbB/YkuD